MFRKHIKVIRTLLLLLWLPVYLLLPARTESSATVLNQQRMCESFANLESPSRYDRKPVRVCGNNLLLVFYFCFICTWGTLPQDEISVML